MPIVKTRIIVIIIKDKLYRIGNGNVDMVSELNSHCFA